MSTIKEIINDSDHQKVFFTACRAFVYSFLGTYIALVTSGADIHWGVMLASSILAALGYGSDKAMRTYPGSIQK